MAKRKHLFALRYPNHEPIYLDRFGSEFRLCGMLVEGKEGQKILVTALSDPFDGKCPFKLGDIDVILPNRDEWIQVLRQMDDPHYFETSPDGTVKAIHRKCQRGIDANTQWTVFRRAGFKCEYCGRNDTPLSVDHYLAVELGGTDEISNLRACDPKCNRRKANMPPAEWEEYMKKRGWR